MKRSSTSAANTPAKRSAGADSQTTSPKACRGPGAHPPGGPPSRVRHRRSVTATAAPVSSKPQAGRAIGPESRARDAIEAVLEAPVDLQGLSLGELARASGPELERRLGLSASEARRLVAGFRLGREVERCRVPSRAAMGTPEAIVRLLAPEARGAQRECFWAVYLDARHRLIEWRCVSIGTLTASLVHPREVLGPALRVGAAAFAAVHNHPSGDPEPSVEDREVTGRLREAGRLVGVPLLDHLILGSPGFVSFRRR
ncbi:MAG: DNA repair protein RadC, partial [Planctomycetota bacterium]